MATTTIFDGGLSVEKRDDGVGVIWLDNPGSPVNVLNGGMLGGFTAALDAVLSDGAVRGVVLASVKPLGFIAGADIEMILPITQAEEATALARELHKLLDRIAGSAKPFVAAINGEALGGGLEVALACHYRVASDHPKTQLGLPEVMLGLLPGGGGTQRLPKLIGLAESLPNILGGGKIRAAKAKKLGLVDHITGPYGIVDVAAAAALQLADGKIRPDRKLKGVRGMMGTFWPLRNFVLKKAQEGVIAKTRGLYPAPLEILKAVEAGFTGSREAGVTAEVNGFGRLVAGSESKHFISIFNGMTALKKAGNKPSKPVHKVAVIGAGLMGEGIASVTLPFSKVVIKDVGAPALGRAAGNIYKALKKRQRSGGLTMAEASGQYASALFTTDYSDLRGTDLVIEAVFEKLELKRQVLADCEAIMRPDAVFATNTSALPIKDIAANAQHPERVLGMHYFSPVPKMPLLEIVVTPQTAEWAIDIARTVGQQQGKTVIVVQDGPGFYTSRILAPFMAEAAKLLAEGAKIRHLDEALMDFGFPVGPVTLLDEVGIDVGAHVGRDLSKAFASRGMTADDSIEKMAEAGLLGRKAGKGFFLYDPNQKGGKKPVNEAAYSYFGGVAARKDFAAKEMVERLAWLMINEAIHCLGEGIIENPRDGDMGAILGLGFPPFRGGPFRYVDDVGIQAALDKLKGLEAKHGLRFAPAPRLIEMAEAGQKFYP